MAWLSVRAGAGNEDQLRTEVTCDVTVSNEENEVFGRKV